jgi:hydroxypyruvate reductase
MGTVPSNALKDDRAWLADAFITAVAAVHPRSALERLAAGRVKKIIPEPRGLGRRRLIAIGKAAGAFSREFVERCPIDDGIVIAPPDAPASVVGLIDVPGDHPVPGEASLAASLRLWAFIGEPSADDVYIVLLTGGASALCVAPIEGVTLEQKRDATMQLMRAGASIAELNQLRRRLSLIKGGGLEQHLAPSRCVTFAISDVQGDDPAVIGSGPTISSEASLAHYFVIATLDDALQAIRREAAKAQLAIVDLGRTLYGTVESEAERVADEIERCRAAMQPDDGPMLLLAGGEPVIAVHSDGQGGRAQHLALAIGARIAGLEGVTVLAAGTDGIDGPTSAAGAFVDGTTRARLQTSGLDIDEALRRCDSHRALAAIGDLWVTGRTDTNVADLLLVLIRPARMAA